MDDKIFPTRDGDSQGASTERVMLTNAGGGDGFKTRQETNLDDSVTTLRTRGGMPEFVTEDAPSGLKLKLVEQSYALRTYFPTTGSDLSAGPLKDPMCVAYIKTVTLKHKGTLTFKPPPTDGLDNIYYKVDTLYSTDGICSFKMYYPKIAILKAGGAHTRIRMRQSKSKGILTTSLLSDTDSCATHSTTPVSKYPITSPVARTIQFAHPVTNAEMSTWPFPAGSPTTAVFQTYAIQTFPYDTDNLYGQPLAGLWKNYSVTTTNGGLTVSHPAQPTGFTAMSNRGCPVSGGVVVVQGANSAVATRTTEQATADALHGLTWRDYGLISGGVYGGSEQLSEPGLATILYSQADGKTYLIQFRYNYWSGGYGTIEYQLRRFGYCDINYAPDAFTVWATMSVPSDFLKSLRWDGGLVTVGQNKRGTDFVIGQTAGAAPITGLPANYAGYCTAMIGVAMSGTVDLTSATLGLTFTVELLADTQTNNSYTTTGTVTSGELSGALSIPIQLILSGSTVSATDTWSVNYQLNPIRGPKGVWPPIEWSPSNPTPWQVVPGAQVPATITTTLTNVYKSVLKTTVNFWAVYINDVRKNITAVIETGQKTVTTYSALPCSGIDFYLAPHLYLKAITDDYNRYINVVISVGTTVISTDERYAQHTHSETQPSPYPTIKDFYNNPSLYPNITYLSSSTNAGNGKYADSLLTAAMYIGWGYGDSGIVTGVFPNFENNYGMPNSCMGKCTINTYMHQQSLANPITVATTAIVAPDGKTIPSTATLDTVYASWQPVTGDFAVDSQVICWI